MKMEIFASNYDRCKVDLENEIWKSVKMNKIIGTDSKKNIFTKINVHIHIYCARNLDK